MSDRLARLPHNGWSLPPLVVGALLVSIAVSGLLDDSGALPHPWWAVPSAAVVLGCLAIVAATVRRVLRGDDVDGPQVGT